MEAIVLAGGFGTRLASMIQGMPKVMAPVGNRPFLELLLQQTGAERHAARDPVGGLYGHA